MPERPNRILEFLTAPSRPDGEASRSNSRRPVSCLIELSWLDEGRWVASRGTLIDISRGGAGIRLRHAPPASSMARLRVIEGEGSPWVEIKVLEVVDDAPDQQRVRIRFEGRCPGFILRQAVLSGTEEEDEPPVGYPYTWSRTGRHRPDF